jgi:glucan phosphoethanolaminetransferase (alkaline phosphatase superfamily)
MSTVNPNSMHRSWYWLALVPLVVGASVTLLKYAWWAAVFSAYYGLPSEAWREEAGPKANFYWWLFMGMSGAGTILATILIPSLKSENLPTILKAIIRFVLAVALVVASIFLVAYGLSAAGSYL